MKKNRLNWKRLGKQCIAFVCVTLYMILSIFLYSNQVRQPAAAQERFCHLCGKAITENQAAQAIGVETNTLGLLCVNSGQAQPLLLYERKRDGSLKSFYGYTKMTVGCNSDHGSGYSGYISMDAARFEGAVQWGSQPMQRQEELTHLYCEGCQTKLMNTHADVILFDYTNYEPVDLMDTRQLQILDYEVKTTRDEQSSRLVVQYLYLPDSARPKK